MWKRLRHQNIVPFIGVTRDPLQFVSEWMPNGTLVEYLERNPGSNQVGLVSFPPVGTDVLILHFSPSCWTWQKVWLISIQNTLHTET